MEIKRKKRELELRAELQGNLVMLTKNAEMMGQSADRYMNTYMTDRYSSTHVPIFICGCVLDCLFLAHPKALDEKKKQDRKAHEAMLQEKLFKENMENLERKQREKIKLQEEERYVRSYIYIYICVSLSV
jgi:hypothetical protein